MIRMIVNWGVYDVWNHFDWTQLLFVTVITTETVLALVCAKRGRTLFSRKPKVADKIPCVDYSGQEVGSPIGPMSVPGNTGAYSENSQKPEPNPKEHVFSFLIHCARSLPIPNKRVKQLNKQRCGDVRG
jgi:hypothetical protein